MLVNKVAGVAVPAVPLSILYLRCLSFGETPAPVAAAAFNSLFEMQVKRYRFALVKHLRNCFQFSI